MHEERLLEECTSNQESISKFIASRVCGCTNETRGVHDDVGMMQGCTNEARVVHDDVSPESSLARLSLGS